MSFYIFCLQRSHKNALRFQDWLAARTQPPPELPDGPAHRLYENHYHTRDARREVRPPNVLADNTTKVIASEEAKG